MKIAISILLVVGLFFGVYKVWEYWDTVQQQKEVDARRLERQMIQGNQLPGLPQPLEAELAKAKQEGPKAFKAFLERIKKSPKVTDPRLAWIELEYVVMVTSENPLEAKRVFREVQERVTPDSPVYKHVKDLEKMYQ